MSFILLWGVLFIFSKIGQLSFKPTTGKIFSDSLPDIYARSHTFSLHITHMNGSNPILLCQLPDTAVD